MGYQRKCHTCWERKVYGDLMCVNEWSMPQLNYDNSIDVQKVIFKSFELNLFGQ